MLARSVQFPHGMKKNIALVLLSLCDRKIPRKEKNSIRVVTSNQPIPSICFCSMRNLLFTSGMPHVSSICLFDPPLPKRNKRLSVYIQTTRCCDIGSGFFSSRLSVISGAICHPIVHRNVNFHEWLTILKHLGRGKCYLILLNQDDRRRSWNNDSRSLQDVRRVLTFIIERYLWSRNHSKVLYQAQPVWPARKRKSKNGENYASLKDAKHGKDSGKLQFVNGRGVPKVQLFTNAAT